MFTNMCSIAIGSHKCDNQISIRFHSKEIATYICKKNIWKIFVEVCEAIYSFKNIAFFVDLAFKSKFWCNVFQYLSSIRGGCFDLWVCL